MSDASTMAATGMPAGSVQELYMDGWRQEFFIKEPRDYAVFEWSARHTEVAAAYNGFAPTVEDLGGDGIVCVSASR